MNQESSSKACLWRAGARQSATPRQDGQNFPTPCEWLASRIGGMGFVFQVLPLFCLTEHRPISRTLMQWSEMHPEVGVAHHPRWPTDQQGPLANTILLPTHSPTSSSSPSSSLERSPVPQYLESPRTARTPLDATARRTGIEAVQNLIKIDYVRIASGAWEQG